MSGCWTLTYAQAAKHLFYMRDAAYLQLKQRCIQYEPSRVKGTGQGMTV